MDVKDPEFLKFPENSVNAPEVRLGNWLSNGGDNYIMDESSLIYMLDLWKVSKNSYWEPIPLTEEWLIRFGFEKQNHPLIDSYEITLPMIGDKRLSVTINKGNQYIYIKDFDTDDYTCRPNDLNCLRNSDSHGEFKIHELQNLFYALTNKELQEVEPEPTEFEKNIDTALRYNKKKD